MFVQLIQEQATETENLQLEDEWTPTPPPRDLIFDDGSPWESNRHRIAMNVLISAVTLAYQNREDYFAGGNMFVYYSSEQARNRDYKGPDFFVALNVDGKRTSRLGSLGRRSYPSSWRNKSEKSRNRNENEPIARKKNGNKLKLL